MSGAVMIQCGASRGDGRDWVGAFTLEGHHDLTDGRWPWTKRYVGKHDVFYQGFNEGKGIWGSWEIAATREYPRQHGGFHIWPEGMADPTGQVLHAAAEVPVEGDPQADTPPAPPPKDKTLEPAGV